jgi:tetratricopeptide (TPR) repeat protein
MLNAWRSVQRALLAPAVAVTLAAAAMPVSAADEEPALEIRSAEACAEAVEIDAEAAREGAAHWYRHGGGAEARLCEAAALEALGAHATAATLLTRLAENPNRVLPRDLRGIILADAARLWVSAGRPETALAALDSSARLVAPDAGAHLTGARAAAALGDWDDARDALDRVLADAPDHALARALRAATLRADGEADAALAEARAALAAAPALAEARFEEAAALAELGRTDDAVSAFLDLAADAPDHDLAPLARSNARSLAGLD